MLRHSLGQKGQMSVELAVVLPVILAVMLVIVDGLMFASESARFEQAAPQAVLACAVTASGDGYDEAARAAEVCEALQAEFSSQSQAVSVETSSSWGIATYLCTLRMAPWPLGRGAVRLFGVELPLELVHECRIAVDPYVIGGLL